jgi:hypothetical protein
VLLAGCAAEPVYTDTKTARPVDITVGTEDLREAQPAHGGN